LTPLETDLANHNTMDFLPKPKVLPIINEKKKNKNDFKQLILNLKGSWVELNNKRQQVNNMTLIVGTLVLLSGLVGV